ncbi:Protein implicated in RNA metabolism containing PRC-barrel domain [Methanonatronarchaeum thermophilum]|uniref:Protein implicated in RNA metabolism containing PRC-barrel domain n=1 Tax=Methanonatronarchaeum thermophilum TaxID=1927129 RepID=A0A1Y3GBC2_9EURY|nr:PRC-barrel domain-containing protein [Methanonatronarchaeum thermophilum]OUJ18728.1 Protein implicated in RNA metabolism containing PRC-barrel domain [Methanonatronarchaeum thermophilum]
MELELTNLLNVDVYTRDGMFVGTTEDAILNIEDSKVEKLSVGNLNSYFEEQLDGANGILLPYRWVLASNDVMIVKPIPTKKKEEEEEETEEKKKDKNLFQ